MTTIARITRTILVARGRKVMLDCDLARLYGVTTRHLNEQVRRNAARFPEDFAFTLSREEAALLRSGRRKPPRVFTEHGAIMAATVLNTRHAVQASVCVVRAFMRLHELLNIDKQLALRIDNVETRLARKLEAHETIIARLLNSLSNCAPQTFPPPRGVH